MARESLEHLIRTKLEEDFLVVGEGFDLMKLMRTWREAVVEDWTLLVGDRDYWETYPVV